MTIYSIEVNAVEIIEADYNHNLDSGKLLFLRSESNDVWKALDITNDTYYSGKSDSTCQCNRDFEKFNQHGYYTIRGSDHTGESFYPGSLTIRAHTTKTFPYGLLRLEILSRLREFRISNLELTEFHPSVLEGANTLNTLE